jgi:hypothetical protein
MPRRNENARPRGQITNDRWRMADLRAMSESIDSRQKAVSSRQNIESRSFTPQSAIRNPQSLAEQIVRDFRRSEGFNTYETAGTMRPLCRPVPRRVQGFKRPFFLKRWIHAVNWDLILIWVNKAINWACVGAVIACLIYLGIFVFGPFTLKLIR